VEADQPRTRPTIDLTGTRRLFGPPVRNRRHTEAGVRRTPAQHSLWEWADNKLIAKVASDSRETAGFTVVPRGEKAGFLALFPCRDFPGLVPPSSSSYGTRCGHGGSILPRYLRICCASFGEWGRALAHRSRGEDLRRVVPREEVKSISREHTFE